MCVCYIYVVYTYMYFITKKIVKHSVFFAKVLTSVTIKQIVSNDAILYYFL